MDGNPLLESNPVVALFGIWPNHRRDSLRELIAKISGECMISKIVDATTHVVASENQFKKLNGFPQVPQDRVVKLEWLLQSGHVGHPIDGARFSWFPDQNTDVVQHLDGPESTVQQITNTTTITNSVADTYKTVKKKILYLTYLTGRHGCYKNEFWTIEIRQLTGTTEFEVWGTHGRIGIPGIPIQYKSKLSRPAAVKFWNKKYQGAISDGPFPGNKYVPCSASRCKSSELRGKPADLLGDALRNLGDLLWCKPSELEFGELTHNKFDLETLQQAFKSFKQLSELHPSREPFKKGGETLYGQKHDAYLEEGLKAGIYAREVNKLCSEYYSLIPRGYKRGRRRGYSPTLLKGGDLFAEAKQFEKLLGNAVRGKHSGDNKFESLSIGFLGLQSLEKVKGVEFARFREYFEMSRNLSGTRYKLEAIFSIQRRGEVRTLENTDRLLLWYWGFGSTTDVLSLGPIESGRRHYRGVFSDIVPFDQVKKGWIILCEVACSPESTNEVWMKATTLSKDLKEVLMLDSPPSQPTHYPICDERRLCMRYLFAVSETNYYCH